MANLTLHFSTITISLSDYLVEKIKSINQSLTPVQTINDDMIEFFESIEICPEYDKEEKTQIIEILHHNKGRKILITDQSAEYEIDSLQDQVFTMLVMNINQELHDIHIRDFFESQIEQLSERINQTI